MCAWTLRRRFNRLSSFSRGAHMRPLAARTKRLRPVPMTRHLRHYQRRWPPSTGWSVPLVTPAQNGHWQATQSGGNTPVCEAALSAVRRFFFKENFSHLSDCRVDCCCSQAPRPEKKAFASEPRVRKTRDRSARAGRHTICKLRCPTTVPCVVAGRRAVVGVGSR